MIGEFTDDTNQVSLSCHTLALEAHGWLGILKIALGIVLVASISPEINMLAHIPISSTFITIPLSQLPMSSCLECVSQECFA